jgi:hypothetical protein
MNAGYGGRYKGWQCNECRYAVFTNSAAARHHLHHVHHQPPELDSDPPPDGGPLQPFTWIGLSAIAGMLLMIVVLVYLAMAR